jgi:hypothetical protein
VRYLTALGLERKARDLDLNAYLQAKQPTPTPTDAATGDT